MANDPMRILKADHREVEKLLDKLADSEEGAEREQMVDELVTKLTCPHGCRGIDRVSAGQDRSRCRRTRKKPQIEHGLAREGLEKVQQMVEMPGFGAAVEMLKGGISHHVEEEETQLLPELKESLDRDAVVGDRRRPRGSKEGRRTARCPGAASQVDQAHQEHQEFREHEEHQEHEEQSQRLMRAAVWHGRRDVRVESVPDPTIQHPDDAIIRVTSSGLCGSDLHLYEVMAPFMTPGDVLGHEPMGIVEAVGSAITNLQVGDRVVVPFNIACGHCYMCEVGLQSQCETTQVHEHDCGAALFGYTKLYGQVPGAPSRTAARAARQLRADQGPRPVLRTTDSCSCPTSCPPPGRASSTPASPTEEVSSCWAWARSARWRVASRSTEASSR